MTRKTMEDFIEPEPVAAVDTEETPAAPAAPARTYFADTETALAYWQSGRTPEECAQMMAAHCDEGGYWIP